MAKYVDWTMEGGQFNGMPTSGNCRALCFVQIDKGHFGDVRLDGLRWGILAAWPSAIHLGNGKFMSVIDERADPKQRQAIEAVSHGKETEAGSLIWQVFSATVTQLLPTVYKPIDLSIDYKARTARLNVPGIVEGIAESIRNPVTGAVHQVKVTMPTGFEFTESEVVSGKSKAAGPIELNLDGTHAHLARIHWSNQGVVR
jgi:hypothetical protein